MDQEIYTAVVAIPLEGGSCVIGMFALEVQEVNGDPMLIRYGLKP